MLSSKINILIVLLLGLFALAPAETVYHKDHLFNLGMGVRPLSLGKAFTAADNDVNAIMFNPAGLASLQKPNLMGLKARRIAEVDQYTVLGSYTLPEDRGVIGLGYLELSLPDILIADPIIDPDGYTQVAGKAKYTEQLYVLSYAKRIEQHAFGVNIKAYTASFTSEVTDIADNAQGNANDIDIGYLYYLNPEWKLGISYRDAIGKMHWSTNVQEKMRSTTKLGAAYAFGWRDHHGNVFFDYEIIADTPGLAHLGVEDTMWEVVTLRLGGLQRVWGNTTKLSFVCGMGVVYKGFSFDYAYFPDVAEETDNKHFVSIGYVFGAETPPPKTQQVYAPTIELYSDEALGMNNDEPVAQDTQPYVNQNYSIMDQ